MNAAGITSRFKYDAEYAGSFVLWSAKVKEKFKELGRSDRVKEAGHPGSF